MGDERKESIHEDIVADDLATEQSTSQLINLLRIIGLAILAGFASAAAGVLGGPRGAELAGIVVFAPLICWFIGRLLNLKLPFSKWRAWELWLYLFMTVISLVSLSLFLNSWYGSYLLDYILQIPLFN